MLDSVLTSRVLLLSQIPTGMPLIQLCFFTKYCIWYTNSFAVVFFIHLFLFFSNISLEIANPKNVPPRPERVKCLAQASPIGSTNTALRGTKIFLVSAENRVQLHWRVRLWPLGRIGIRPGGVTEGHHP